MEKKVWDYIQKHQMIQPGDRIVLGFSGGPDSVVLLHLLLKYQKEIDFQLCALHVNHNLRGEEALRDAAFTKEFCEKRQVEYICVSRDVASLARTEKMSGEEAGRVARYEAFEEQKKVWNGNKIALAHHKNDEAETMIHHLCRGSGLTGMCGIYPVQHEKIRPLLCLERREIEQYLEEQQIPFVTDSTNNENEYTRNRIRHQVMEALEQGVNAKTVEHMASTAADFRKIEDYLGRTSSKLLNTYGYFQRDASHIQEDFYMEEPVLVEYGLREAFRRAAGSGRDLSRIQVEELTALGHKQVGKRVLLPGGFQALRTYEGVSIVKGHKNGKHTHEKEVLLPIPGEVFWGSSKITTRILENLGQEIPQKSYTKWLNYDRIKGLLQLRNRKAGDYLVINRDGGCKKLKDYFIDSKIPREVRDDVPLITIGSQVLWAVGLRLSEAYKIDDYTKEILEITYEGVERHGRED